MSRLSLRQAVFLGLMIGFALVLEACQAPTESQLSHSPGDIGRNIASERWSLWADLSSHEALAELAKQGEAFKDLSISSLDDPKRLKLQGAVDRMADLLELSYPQTPRPQVMLVKSDSKRVFNFGIPVCLPILLQWNDHLPKAGALQSSAAGVRLLESEPFNQCQQLSDHSEQDKIEWVRKVLPFSQDCLNFEAGFFVKMTVTIDQDCVASYAPLHFRSRLLEFGSAGTIITHQAANWIVVYEGALSRPEGQLTAILAHELAHYYRAHTMVGQGYDYFYHLNEPANPFGTPEPLTQNDALYDLASQMKEINPSGLLSSGQRSLLKQAMREGLGYYTAEQEADEVALEYLTLIGESPLTMAEALLDDLREFAHGARYPMLPAGIDWGYQKCREAFAAGFPEPVGVGIYHQPHHSNCFRVFNIYRELESHFEHFQSLGWNGEGLAVR